MSDSVAVVAIHVTAVDPHHLHRDVGACDRLSVERARKVVDVHSLCHVPDVAQPKVPPFVAGGLCPLVLAREGLEDVVFVLYRLSHFFEEVAAFVQDENEVVRILAVLHLRIDEILVARQSDLFSVAAVLLSQSLPRHLSMPRSIFWPLFLDLRNDVVSGVRRGKK